MKSKLALLLVFACLAGCEGPQALIYNMTSCAVTITYSAANINNFTVRLAPSSEAGTTGAFPPELKEIKIIDGAGRTHPYSAPELASLRQSGRSDLWAYYPDGLKFITDAPSPAMPAANPTERCSG